MSVSVSVWCQCWAMLSVCIPTHTASLSPPPLPEFDEQPQDVTVMEGERTGFPCALDTMPAPSIKGFRNSHPLEPDSRMTRLPSGGCLQGEGRAERKGSGRLFCPDPWKIALRKKLTINLGHFQSFISVHHSVSHAV